MGKIKIGNSDVRKVFFGTSTVKKIYYGNTLVFSSTPQYTITINDGTYSECFLSTSNYAYDGPKSLTVDQNEVVFAFVKLTQDIDTRYIDSTWFKVNSVTHGQTGAIYRVGNVYATRNYSFGTIHARTLIEPDIRIDPQESIYEVLIVNHNPVNVSLWYYCYWEGTSGPGDYDDETPLGYTVTTNKINLFDICLSGSLDDYSYIEVEADFSAEADGWNTSHEADYVYGD